MSKVRIYIGSDHAGFDLKEKLKPFIEKLGYNIKDLGNFVYDENDDYPDWISPVAKEVARNPENSKGIILGGSGQGEAIVANRISGIRAAVYYGGPEKIITLSKEHNDANILSLGARFLTKAKAKKVIKLWLETPFSKEKRHERRIKKIDRNN